MPLSHAHSALIPFLLSAGALGMALLSQYGFGTHPCHLCLLQRYPYGVVMLASLLFIFARRWWRSVCWLIIILSFISTASIAGYHFGVEQGWVPTPDSCAITAQSSGSLDDLKAMILASPLVSCADVGAGFLGLSMAGWNVLYGLACAFTCVLLVRRNA